MSNDDFEVMPQQTTYLHNIHLTTAAHPHGATGIALLEGLDRARVTAQHDKHPQIADVVARTVGLAILQRVMITQMMTTYLGK